MNSMQIRNIFAVGWYPYMYVQYHPQIILLRICNKKSGFDQISISKYMIYQTLSACPAPVGPGFISISPDSSKIKPRSGLSMTRTSANDARFASVTGVWCT